MTCILTLGLSTVHCASVGPARLDPSPLLEAYLEAIETGRADDARALLSDDLQLTYSSRDFRALMDQHQRHLSGQVQRLKSDLEAMTPVELVWVQVGPRTLELMHTPSGWRIVREVRRPCRDGREAGLYGGRASAEGTDYD